MKNVGSRAKSRGYDPPLTSTRVLTVLVSTFAQEIPMLPIRTWRLRNGVVDLCFLHKAIA